jgi:hypothetical protein
MQNARNALCDIFAWKRDANPETPRYSIVERALKSPMEFVRTLLGLDSGNDPCTWEGIARKWHSQVPGNEQVVTKISTVILHKLGVYHFITVNSKEVKYFHDILALRQPSGMDGNDERGATFLQEPSTTLENQ